MRRSTFCTFLLFSLFLLPFALTGQSSGDTLNLLFVGNSYTYGNNLPHIVSLISEETSTMLMTRKSVIGGARLTEHWNGKRGLRTREIIEEGVFDLVVLQDHSMSAMTTPDTTRRYIRLFSQYNQKFGADTWLFNTWAREKVPQYQKEIDAMYQKAARDQGVNRVPVGTAWKLAMELRPSVGLFTGDGSHPNELGTLLTAAVFVRFLSGELPDPMPSRFLIKDARGETVRLMNHNPEDAEFCRRIAHQVAADLGF